MYSVLYVKLYATFYSANVTKVLLSFRSQKSSPSRLQEPPCPLDTDMPLRLRVANPPRHWTAVRKMRLQTGKSGGSRHRPDTATLEKPLILDPGLLRKVDMTRLTRDRLLTIENLLATPKKSRATPKVREKLTKSRTTSREGRTESGEDEESAVLDEFKLRKPRLNTTFRVKSHVRKGLREVFSSTIQLQVPPDKEVVKVKSPKIKENRPSHHKKSVEDVFGALIVKENIVPSPCNACGRSEKPERLHAHPSMPQNKRSRMKEDQENLEKVVLQKSSVTKPVAMKFRSGKNRKEKHAEGDKSSPDLPKFTQKETKEQKKSMPLIRRETFRIDKGSKPTLSVEKKQSSPSPSPTRKVPAYPSSIPRRPALPRTPKHNLAVPSSPLPLPVPVNPPVVHSASSRRTRTITCYLCQKQFGTASYPLHEPQCLQVNTTQLSTNLDPSRA